MAAQLTPRGLFGRRDILRGPYDTPGIGDGFGGQPAQIGQGVGSGSVVPATPIEAQQPAPVAWQRPSTGRMIAGIIGDSLSQWSGGQAHFLPAMMRQQQAAQETAARLQDDVRRRAADRSEWAWREQWKVDHPDDQFTRYLVSAGIDPRSAKGQAMYRQRAESMAAPPLMAVDGFDAQGNQTKTFYPRTAFGAAGTAEPTPSAGPAVGTERNGYRFRGGNPNDRNSWVPVGSAPPAGGATFR